MGVPPVRLPASGDLTSTAPGQGWLVCGWFTPDYRPRAERLAAGLARHGAPFHLREVAKLGGTWKREVMRKPAVVLEAIRAHLNSTIVFMDVDCEIRAPIEAAANIAADVSCFFNVKKRGRRQTGDVSSRVMVLRPTAGAARLIEAWVAACAEDPGAISDEPSLMVALARAAGSSWTALDPRFAGREVTAAPPGAAIVHDSAREDSSPLRRLNRRLKALRRSALGGGTRGLVHK